MSTMHATRRPALWTAALASAACLLGVGAASAADAMTTTQQVPVSYRDLDLSTPSGASALYSRIQTAARVACGFPDSKDLHRDRDARACSDKAISAAVSEVNNPLLTAIHNAKSPVKLTAMN
jgi:UrcA family protein